MWGKGGEGEGKPKVIPWSLSSNELERWKEKRRRRGVDKGDTARKKRE